MLAGVNEEDQSAAQSSGLTWGVRLLSSSQQLPREEPPSLHAEEHRRRRRFSSAHCTKSTPNGPCQQYLLRIWTPGSSRPLPSHEPTAGLRCPTGRARPASDSLSLEGGVAAASCCDWSSTSCFVRWALGASWTCTPSTFLKRKQEGGGGSANSSGFSEEKKTTEQKQSR